MAVGVAGDQGLLLDNENERGLVWSGRESVNIARRAGAQGEGPGRQEAKTGFLTLASWCRARY